MFYEPYIDGVTVLTLRETGCQREIGTVIIIMAGTRVYLMALHSCPCHGSSRLR